MLSRTAYDEASSTRRSQLRRAGSARRWAAALFGLAALLPLAGASAPRPNILVILVDDLRHDGLAATGHPFVDTPHIDRIAAEGLTFRQAFVTTPLCSPSRASFYTGEWVRDHGIRANNQNGSTSDASLRTWARALQKAGYRTAHIGKWHMDPSAAPRHGFDRWVSFEQQGEHTDPLLDVDGVPTPTTGYTTEILTDEAIAFALDASDPRPFAITLALKAVHGGFPADDSHVPPAFRGLYDAEPLPRPPNAVSGYTLDDKPALLDPPNGYPAPVPGQTGTSDSIIRSQLRMTAHVDFNVGRLLGDLQSAGRLDDTLVVVTSDNGYMWGEHGLGFKGLPYEPSIRVPLLMRHPSLVPAGTSSDALVLNTDVAPTLLELAGIAPGRHIHGRSLVPLLADPTGLVRDAFVGEYYLEDPVGRVHTWEMLRSSRWKLVTYPDLGPDYDELYDLSTDPHEMTNLAGDPAAAQSLLGMRARLSDASAELTPRHAEHRVPGDALDYGLFESGQVPLYRGANRIGSDTSPPGGRNAVLVFPIPPRLEGEPIDRAWVDFRTAVLFDQEPPPWIHADLWILGIGSTSPMNAYLESQTDPDASHELLADDVLWWDRAGSYCGIHETAAERLADRLRAFYAAHPGYQGGSYLHLRFNPDGDTGTGRTGWAVLSSDHPTPGFRPVLRLERPTDCANGRDDDGDGRIDFDGGQSVHGLCIGSCPPGVSDPDGDGTADPDPSCLGPESVQERGAACGLGLELCLLAPVLWGLRRVSRAAPGGAP